MQRSATPRSAFLTTSSNRTCDVRFSGCPRDRSASFNIVARPFTYAYSIRASLYPRRHAARSCCVFSLESSTAFYLVVYELFKISKSAPCRLHAPIKHDKSTRKMETCLCIDSIFCQTFSTMPHGRKWDGSEWTFLCIYLHKFISKCRHVFYQAKDVQLSSLISHNKAFESRDEIRQTQLDQSDKSSFPEGSQVGLRICWPQTRSDVTLL